MTTRDADHIEWPAGDTAARVLGASQIRRGPIATAFLSTLALLYGSATTIRNAAFDAGLKRVYRASIPVISVGNVVAGGAGKTPFTRWLVEVLESRGKRAAILHGGYASDEPDLHRSWHGSALVFEERDRVSAVAKAAAAGADIAVLDDAFQHRRLARDIDIVLVPAESTSRHLLPRGPLRESAENIARADLIVVTRKSADAEAVHKYAMQLEQQVGKPTVVAGLMPNGLRNLEQPERPLEGRATIVTAIARPDLLLQQVRGMGVKIARTLAYPDHYDFREKDVQHILRAAEDQAIVTTEKDAVKLAALIPPGRLWVVEQSVAIERGYDAFLAVLERVL